MEQIQIHPIEEKDKKWLEEFFIKEWESIFVVSKGKKYNLLELPGFIAEIDTKQVGVITYTLNENECEIVSINSTIEGKGIGSHLIAAVIKMAKENTCKRVWLIETNDNTHALKFYQKRGFHLIAVYPDALIESRKHKPEIPLIGSDGIPIRDELELEMLL